MILVERNFFVSIFMRYDESGLVIYITLYYTVGFNQFDHITSSPVFSRRVLTLLSAVNITLHPSFSVSRFCCFPRGDKDSKSLNFIFLFISLTFLICWARSVCFAFLKRQCKIIQYFDAFSHRLFMVILPGI